MTGHVMDDPLQAARLGEALLEHGSACHWVLGRDLQLICVYGRDSGLFPIPETARELWCEKLAAALDGRGASWRESRGSRLYQVNLFPLPGPYAGGFGFQITPWSDAERSLRDAALQVMRTRESERLRLARVLHDEIGQSLSVAGLQLDLLRMDLEAIVPSMPERTAEVQQVLETVMQRVRDLSQELNPAAADRVGLYAALDRLVGRIRGAFPGTLRFMADTSLRLPGPAAAALYRIAEDALEDAVRHSGCSRIDVLVKSTREGPTLEVHDNGDTFDAADSGTSARGLAALIMGQYAAEAGLRFSISSRRGHGTVVKAIYNGGNEGASHGL